MFKKRKREKNFGILDIGSESVKCLVASRSYIKGKEKTVLLGKGLEPFEFFGVFDGREFEMDVMKKAIKKATEDALDEAKTPIETLVISLPVHIFKAKILEQNFKRENPKSLISEKERQEIFKKIFRESRKTASENFAKETGILPEELCFISERVLQIKINGYEVPDLAGFSGKDLEFKILLTFLPKYYLAQIQKLIRISGLQISKILHESEGLSSLVKDETTLFLDIGADFTQIFLVKKGILSMVSGFKGGGRNFTRALCEKFGILPQEANSLVVRYQRHSLEEETRARLREIFLREAKNWLLNLNTKLEDKGFFEKILCFGGGAYFPEILEVLEKEYGVLVKTLTLKDFLGIEDKTKGGIGLQFIPTLFLIYAI